MGTLTGNKSKNAIQDDSYTAAQNERCAIYLWWGARGVGGMARGGEQLWRRGVNNSVLGKLPPKCLSL